MAQIRSVAQKGDMRRRRLWNRGNLCIEKGRTHMINHKSKLRGLFGDQGSSKKRGKSEI